MTEILAEVSHALRTKVDRSPTSSQSAYDSLMEELRTGEDPQRFCALFRALGQNAALIAKNHASFEDLLALTFVFNWTFEDSVCESFELFLRNLVSAHAGFLQPVLELLIKNFFPPGASLEATAGRLGEDDFDDDDDEDEETGGLNGEQLAHRAERVHNTIRSILRILPLGCTTLLSVLLATFPKHRHSTSLQKAYFEQVLRVCDYVPILRDRILAAAVEKLLHLDALVRIDELEQQQEAMAEANAISGGSNAVFSMEEDDELNNNNIEGDVDASMAGTGSDSQAAENVPLASQDPAVAADLALIREYADKLDVLLDLFFQYADLQIDARGRTADIFVNLMLNIFDRMILPRRNVSSTQYIIFYVCRKRPEWVDRFLQRLAERALNLANNTPAPVRFNAASYLASFLARALYVSKEACENAVSLMFRFLMDYDQRFVTNNAGAIAKGGFVINPAEHIQFLAVAQAVVYILTFKGNDFSPETLHKYDLGKLVNSPLSPQAYISEDIVAEFARFASAQQMLSQADLDMLMSGVQASRKVDANGHTRLQHGAERREVLHALSTHYPFDPCVLKRTATRVAPLYQYWFSSEGGLHADEYETAQADIDTSMATEEASEAESDVDAPALGDDEIRDAQRRLPPAIQIPGLSERAARILSQLGALNHSPKSSGGRYNGSDLIGNNFWALDNVVSTSLASSHDDAMSFTSSSYPRGASPSGSSMAAVAASNFGGEPGSMRSEQSVPSSLGSQISSTPPLLAPKTLPISVPENKHMKNEDEDDNSDNELAGSW